MNKTQGKRMKKIMDMAKRPGEGRVKILSSLLRKIKLKKVHVGGGVLSIMQDDERG
jgi:hypothetical protein